MAVVISTLAKIGLDALLKKAAAVAAKELGSDVLAAGLRQVAKSGVKGAAKKAVKKKAASALKNAGLESLKGTVNDAIDGGVQRVVQNVVKKSMADLFENSGLVGLENITIKDLPNPKSITRKLIARNVGEEDLKKINDMLRMVKDPKGKALSELKKQYQERADRVDKVIRAQEKARALIAEYQRLGWDVKESIVERANRKVPWNITEKQAEAMIDNLSPSTIKILRTMKTTLKWEEYNEKPKVSGHQRSGANIYDVDPYATHEVKRTVEFGQKQIPRELMKQIKFVMESAPSSITARELWDKLELFQDMTGVKVLKEDASVGQLVEGLKGAGALRRAAEAAEKEGNPGYSYLMKIYDELVNRYGFDDYGIAAKQARDVRHSIDMGAQGAAEDGDTPEQVESRRSVASRVVRRLISMGEKWQNYREQYKLRFSRWHAIYSSFDVIDDMTDAIMEEPDLENDILDKMEEIFAANIDPSQIKEILDAYVAKHRTYNGVFAEL